MPCSELFHVFHTNPTSHSLHFILPAYNFTEQLSLPTVVITVDMILEMLADFLSLSHRSHRVTAALGLRDAVQLLLPLPLQHSGRIQILRRRRHEEYMEHVHPIAIQPASEQTPSSPPSTSQATRLPAAPYQTSLHSLLSILIRTMSKPTTHRLADICGQLLLQRLVHVILQLVSAISKPVSKALEDEVKSELDEGEEAAGILSLNLLLGNIVAFRPYISDILRLMRQLFVLSLDTYPVFTFKADNSTSDEEQKSICPSFHFIISINKNHVNIRLKITK
ncbi:hypothetical protein BLNAU_19208 [Blattamonas nauphoetae]|uniref:Uncharacterized protein n=2 Tax=Blattamonas nauphoetae TaxID=2049346 RepID=A0ABQ9X2C0_9EUKA|nr:hypothetical protein BLNAU_19208 [Blattamonas nauphoetae]